MIAAAIMFLGATLCVCMACFADFAAQVVTQLHRIADALTKDKGQQP